MSTITFTHSALLARDAQGRYQPASIEQILNAARQIIDQRIHRGTALVSPQLVREFLQVKLSGFEHEVFALLLLDNKHRLIEYIEMFRGTIDSAAVYPREVIKETLKHNAAAVIFSHNHPSGSTEPSMADRLLTQRLKDALALIDVRVLDHIIVAGLDTYSFTEHGWL